MDIVLAQSANFHHVEASYMPNRVCSRRQPALSGGNVPAQPRLSLDLVTGPPSFPGAYFQQMLLALGLRNFLPNLKACHENPLAW